MESERHFDRTVTAASVITLLAAAWLFLSPWIYGASMMANAWNSWAIGAVIAILAIFRLANPTGTVWMSWLNCLLAAWTFFSPWIFGFKGEHGRFINSLCVGIIILFMELRSATATPRTGSTSAHGV
jgi:SPW repeat